MVAVTGGTTLTNWLQLLVSGITLGAIYALMALGYVTIYRTSHVVNMAQGCFVMMGTIFAYSLLNEIGSPYWLSTVVTIPAVVVRGDVICQVILKPIMKAPPAT